MDNQDLSYTAHIFVASISGIVNILITTPLWVATTRITIQDRQQEKEQLRKQLMLMHDVISR